MSLSIGGAADPLEPSLHLSTTRQLEAGVASMQGRRADMQDAHLCVVPLPMGDRSGASGWFRTAAVGDASQEPGVGSDRTGLFGVFDGHGGTYAAKFGSKHMLEMLQARPEWGQAWAANGDTGYGQAQGMAAGGTSSADPAAQARLLASAVAHSFLDVDTALRSEVAKGAENAGSTAVLAVLTDTLLLVGNAGDSRAVLFRVNGGGGGGAFASTEQAAALGQPAQAPSSSMPMPPSKSAVEVYAVPLTHDHKPDSPSEKYRIESAGSEVYIKRRGGVPRIDGNLAVSRGLGDHDFKYRPDLPLGRQAVSSLPDVTVIHRDDSLDGFLLLACDGVWDVMEPDDVARLLTSWIASGTGGQPGATPGQEPQVSDRAVARAASQAGTFMQAGPPPAVDMAGWSEAIIREGYERGSGDNLTAMLVALPAGMLAIGRGPVRGKGAKPAQATVQADTVPTAGLPKAMAQSPLQVPVDETGTPLDEGGGGGASALKKPRLEPAVGQPSQAAGQASGQPVDWMTGR